MRAKTSTLVSYRCSCDDAVGIVDGNVHVAAMDIRALPVEDKLVVVEGDRLEANLGLMTQSAN